MNLVRIDARKITDWNSFHDTFSTALGFPDFYGRNLAAWVDCLTRLDEGMSAVSVPVGDIVVTQLDDVADFASRCPEQYNAVVELSACVNWRRIERGNTAVVALSFYK